jgi:hypothetical protein
LDDAPVRKYDSLPADTPIVFTPAIALASTLPVKAPVAGFETGAEQGIVNSVPSAVVASKTVCPLVVMVSGPTVWDSGGHFTAKANSVVPLGIERLTLPDEMVWAAKAPDPIFAATAVGVGPFTVNVTTVGLLPPPPPAPPLDPPPQPAITTINRARADKRINADGIDIPFRGSRAFPI